MTKDRIKDVAKLVLFLGIGFFFVYWFLLKLDGQTKADIWQSVKGANYWWVGAAMAVDVLGLLFRALRWRILYEPLGTRPSVNNTFGSVVITYFANLAFPRLGDILRCGTMRTSEDIPVEKSLGTVVTERVVDILCYLLIMLVGVVVMFSDLKEWFGEGFAAKLSDWPVFVGLAAGGICLMAAAVWGYRHYRARLLRNGLFAKIDKFIVGCIDGLKSIFYLKKKSLFWFVAYSVLTYASYVLSGLVIFYAFPETSVLGLKEAWVIYLFGSMGMLISQGGIGAYPTLVQTALGLYGISIAVGAACGWVMWSAMQVLSIVLGMIYAVYFSLAKRSKKESGRNEM